jgi:aryl-alcohol dehydrogenase-like predicted oxidoreductase
VEEREFGRTGEKFPILSFGGQRIVDERGCSEEEAMRILNRALDVGIRYFDTAWMYSGGQSEERIGKVARHRRQEMWIATKVSARDRDGAAKQVRESLRRLQTDHVDELRIHNVWSFEELDKVTGPGGALEALVEARELGLARYLSISGHSNPQVQVAALDRFPFDSVLCALSALDHFILSFAEEFLPFAKAKGVAVIAMKVLGFGSLVRHYENALRYTFGLPISTAIVGVDKIEQLEKNLAVAENFVPFSDAERLEFLKEIMPGAVPRRMRWKAEDEASPTEWKKR